MITAYEGFGGDEPLQPVECLLPMRHSGPHADWTAWIGVTRPNFDVAGGSWDDEQPVAVRDQGGNA